MVSDTEAGTPQGSPISPLLANIALHVLDEAWAGDGRRLGTLVRYCDDFVVLCPTAGTGRSGPGPGGGDPGTARAAPAPRQDQDRASPPRGRRGSTSWASTTAWWSPGNGRVATTSSKWPSRPGHGLHQGQGPRADAPSGYVGLRSWPWWSTISTPCCGAGAAYFRHGQLVAEVRRRRQLRPRTAGAAGQQQARTPRAQLGQPLQLRAGSADLGIYRLTGTVRYRAAHACDERCRRAVCGRTARTVR